MELHPTARFTELHGYRHIFFYFIHSILRILLLILILNLGNQVSQPNSVYIEMERLTL